jgi:transposase
MLADDDAITRPAQRVEVFTGAGRRRACLHEEKARIVAEIASSGDSVCAVARRHGLSPQQLFGWQRRLRDAEAASAEAGGVKFLPAAVDAEPPAVASRGELRLKAETIAGTIEIEIGGVKIRIGPGMDAERKTSELWPENAAYDAVAGVPNGAS